MPRSVKLARIALIASTALNLVLAAVALLQAQALLDSLRDTAEVFGVTSDFSIA
ncbi:hypothetical protein [Kitasatospora griseola]|uniref:hypothetical protein n=1 Tax=Kitasatospora griseola TaxID=2064 RepID=UPI000AC6A598|nr:hypothetical protein [Kitasatospora griseola]